MNKGLIHQIIGPVVDVKFDPEELPKLNNIAGWGTMSASNAFAACVMKKDS